ncbi:hypothetical protein P5673_033692 [Acropora cervicornis]|uniref:Uncharacterized protein n=1 Tax=Acropora cervicornis TaxID=6130 RepID=A0AAD9UR38_ACRCE|nr:hypothetical protein P5673_033692 [Acropora cervicornis]
MVLEVMKEEFDEEWLEGVQLHLNIQPRDREEKQDREAADIRNALKNSRSFGKTSLSHLADYYPLYETAYRYLRLYNKNNQSLSHLADYYPLYEIAYRYLRLYNKNNQVIVPSGYFVGLEILFNLNCFYDLILVWDSQCASSPRVSMDFYLCLMPLFQKEENREMSKYKQRKKRESRPQHPQGKAYQLVAVMLSPDNNNYNAFHLINK